MDSHRLHRRIALLVPLALAFGALSASGQRLQPGGRRGGEQEERPERIIRVRSLEGLGSRANVRTPEFDARTNITRGTKPQQDWVRIRLEYDTYPDWIDELTMRFHALALTTEDRRRSYSLYTKTVRYGDIEQGRSHYATAFLLPVAVKRFGDVVAVAVEVVYEGEVIAAETDTSIDMPERWWENKTVTESEGVTPRSGYLLNRQESPFALINIDDHEVIK